MGRVDAAPLIDSDIKAEWLGPNIWEWAPLDKTSQPVAARYEIG